MPSTEETFRNQRTLHAVFAVTSVAMTLSIVWMIMADHLRPWKSVQRGFQHVEDAKLRAQEAEKLAEQKVKYQTQIEALDAKIKEAENLGHENSGKIRTLDKEIKTLTGRVDLLDTRKKFTKAELDSQRSLYDGKIDLGDNRGALEYKNGTIVATERLLDEASRELEVAEAELKTLKAQREDLVGHVDDLVKQREQLTRDADRVSRVIVQKENQYFGFLAALRNLPGVDLVPPTKIQQISLPELTINYNFKEVPRYDRCTTCHMGTDRLGYDVGADGKPLPTVYASHPHLTDATALDPKGNLVKAGLYLDANGPHPINSFGCTICHGGQGSGTDFTYSSHEPNDLHQKEEWEHTQNWSKIHHWDEPMLPSRFMESSCLKCHHQVTDVPQAKKLQAGYERITKFGCTGCHTIGGEGSFGPDLTDERQVGPNLAHIGSKLSKDFTAKWIKNPHAFRPDSRMPRFYGVTNNNAHGDWPKNHAEIQAITAYLFAKSTPPEAFVEPPAKADAGRGKTVFLQKGCLACHAHRPYDVAEVQPADKTALNAAYKPDRAATYDPSVFPEAVRGYAKADFGPNLGNLAAKFKGAPQAQKWLTNWIKAPESYHPKSLMPNLQLGLQDAADVAAWLLTVPGEWPVALEVPAADSKEVKEGVDELVTLYVRKGGITRNGKFQAVPLADVDRFVSESLTHEEKLLYLGEKTISRLGCFGCHTIPGFENAKPIGTPLNGWGVKSPAKLDYGHIAEYLEDSPVDDTGSRDGTSPYFQEQLADHTRGFLYEKLHRPRSYDFKKTNKDIKAWDDRLRMPQFAWANDPAAVEEVMTFVLGLTAERIGARYLPKTRYTPRQHALAQGAKVLNRYNCTGCHVVGMPKYEIAAGKPVEEALTGFKNNLRASYNNRGSDYLKAFYPSLTFDDKTPVDADKIEAALKLTPDTKAGVTIEGMPIGVFENELTVQLWRPVTIRGYTFNVGDTLTLDASKVKKTEADGGNFAWLFSTYQAEANGDDIAKYWNRLPPPLLREGKKVQTPWLSGFLKDPYPIRPAVNLRMPRFHYGVADDSARDETSLLANYFAAVDGAEFPYQSIPERTQAYLAEKESKHPDYFSAGWTMMTTKTSPCLSCHAIGPYKPTGGDQVVNGPDLRQVASRFRPGYLEEWLAKPSRLIPYTAMPQNIAPTGTPQLPVPKSFEGNPHAQVLSIRDTLLNYVNVVEQQMVAGTKPEALKDKDASAPASKAAAGGSE